MQNKTRIRAWLVLGVLGLCLSAVGARLYWLDSPRGRETLAGGYVDKRMLGLMNRLLAKGVFQISDSGAVVVKASALEGEVTSPSLRDKVRRYAGAAWLRPGAKGFDPRLFKVSAPRQWAGETILLKGRILDRRGRALAYSELMPQGLRQKRRYPLGGAASQVVGFSHPVYGRLGLEAALASSLEQPVHASAALAGRTVKLSRGGDVLLTLDSKMQRAAYDAMQGKNGAVVILDVATGGILAAAGTPSFDPNQTGRQAWLEARKPNHGKGPLVARAWSRLYPPGSTFKLVVAAAWLEAHLKDGKLPGVRYCGKKDHALNISDLKAHGKMDLHNALVKSCNVYFANLGVKLGPKVRDMAVRFGFNQGLDLLPQLTGSSLLAEPSLAYAGYRYQKEQGVQGVTTSRELKLFKNFRRDYKIAAQCAIGQNLIAATPLQMAMVAQAIANRGELMLPYLVSQMPDPKAPGGERLLPPLSAGRVMDPRTADFLTEAMKDVVKRGTARLIERDLAMPLGFTVAGKNRLRRYRRQERPVPRLVRGFCPGQKPQGGHSGGGGARRPGRQGGRAAGGAHIAGSLEKRQAPGNGPRGPRSEIMNILTRADFGLGAVLERVFNFRPGFMPADLARHLKRAALRGELRTLTGRMAPDHYWVGIAPLEMERLLPIREEIENDLARCLEGFFREEGLGAEMPVKVRLKAAGEQYAGVPEIRSGFGGGGLS